MNEAEVLARFRRARAFDEGHFLLASGLHASRFFRASVALSDPKDLSEFGEALAQRFVDNPPDAVIGANIAGVLLASCVGRVLACRLVIAESTSGSFGLAPGFAFKPTESVLVVDDVTTTGGTIKSLLTLVRSKDANPRGVALLATKGLARLDFGVSTEVLAQLEGMDAVPEEMCKSCREKLPFSV